MTMRVFFMGNNWTGWKVLEWLEEDDRQDVVGAAFHPPGERNNGKELLDAVDLPEERILDASQLNEPDTRRTIEELSPDIGLSCFLGYILEGETLDLFPEGVLNLHPAYLPYNRGAYPNVWSILDGTPAGATLHYLDEGIDTGPIVAQEEAEVRPDDTGKSLYHRLEHTCLSLFKDVWPRVLEEDVEVTPQESDEGTYHEADDVEEIDRIDLDSTYTGRELIDILRARTFPPHDGAYFEIDEGRVYIEVDLELREEST